MDRLQRPHAREPLPAGVRRCDRRASATPRRRRRLPRTRLLLHRRDASLPSPGGAPGRAARRDDPAPGIRPEAPAHLPFAPPSRRGAGDRRADAPPCRRRRAADGAGTGGGACAGRRRRRRARAAAAAGARRTQHRPRAMRTPPNILFVMADQLTASVLPVYGGPVDGPNLTTLAAEGVVFESAYCSTPLCAPSRASLLAGQLPSTLGAYDNGAEFPASVPTIAHYLRASGYQTCLAGKMHFIGPDQLHGFEERLTTDIYTAGLDWIPDWSLPLDERLPWYHDMSSVLEAGVSEATLQLDYDEEVGFRSVRKLYDLARASDR